MAAGNDLISLRTEVTDPAGDPVVHRLRHPGRPGAGHDARRSAFERSPSATQLAAADAAR